MFSVIMYLISITVDDKDSVWMNETIKSKLQA